MSFNKTRSRDMLLKDGTLDWMLSHDIEESLVSRSLRNSTTMYALTSIRCFVVGLNDVGRNLAEKARQFGRLSNDVGEIPPRDYFLGATEASTHHSIALMTWLIEDRHDAGHLQKYLELEQLYHSTAATGVVSDSEFFVPLCCDAGAWTLGVEFYLRSVPRKRGGSVTGADVAYAFCKSELEGNIDRQQLLASAASFARRSALSWVERGHYFEFAQWAKIAFWNMATGKPAAIECLHRMLAE